MGNSTSLEYPPFLKIVGYYLTLGTPYFSPNPAAPLERVIIAVTADRSCDPIPRELRERQKDQDDCRIGGHEAGASFRNSRYEP